MVPSYEGMHLDTFYLFIPIFMFFNIFAFLFLYNYNNILGKLFGHPYNCSLTDFEF